MVDEVEILYREVVGQPGTGWIAALAPDVVYIEVSSIDLRFGRLPIDREAVSGPHSGERAQASITAGHTIALRGDIQACAVGRRSWGRAIFGPLFGMPVGPQLTGGWNFIVSTVPGVVELRIRGSRYRVSSANPDAFVAAIRAMTSETPP